jgi:hypothetical protein
VNVEVEASHFDPATAYVAVDYHYLGDYSVDVYRTRDFGKTWTKITTGLPADQPSGGFARVIREDPKRRGLLFTGTESGMFVSFDDGDHWQSLLQNLPNTSYRDIAIRGNDLVVATYGRGIWVLDDISTLRQLTPVIATAPLHLFAPGDVTRLRRNVNADTPFPPEVPQALNPPDGVIVDYWLAQPAHDVALDVLDASGNVVRHLSSAPVAPVTEAARPPHPNFWLASPAPLPTAAGTNRVSWDLRYDDPPAVRHSFEINANPGRTPPSPEGLLALPGVYTLRLTADGKSATRTVTVRPDPRAPASLAALRAQHALQMKLAGAIAATAQGWQQALALRALLRQATSSAAAAEIASASAALGGRIDTVAGTLDASRARGRGAATAPPNFVGLNGALVAQLEAQDAGDMAPTAAALAAWAHSCTDLRAVIDNWTRVMTSELAAINTTLTTRGVAPLRPVATTIKPPSC